MASRSRRKVAKRRDGTPGRYIVTAWIELRDTRERVVRLRGPHLEIGDPWQTYPVSFYIRKSTFEKEYEICE